MITIEGARGVGKTTLLSKLDSRFTVYKYSFVESLQSFPNLLSNGKSAISFALGRDIQTIRLNNTGLLNDLVLDRGFLSNLVYSVINKRCSLPLACVYFTEVVKNILPGNFKIIMIKRPGDKLVFERDRTKDVFDHIDEMTYGEQEDIYNVFLRSLPEGVVRGFIFDWEDLNAVGSFTDLLIELQDKIEREK